MGTLDYCRGYIKYILYYFLTISLMYKFQNKYTSIRSWISHNSYSVCLFSVQSLTTVNFQNVVMITVSGKPISILKDIQKIKKTDSWQKGSWKCGNGNMKLAHLQRSNINIMLVSHQRFLKRKVSDFFTASDKVKSSQVEASYVVSLLIEKPTSYSPFPKDVLATDVMAETILDKNATDKLKPVSLSNCTICCRLGTDIILTKWWKNLKNLFHSS